MLFSKGPGWWQAPVLFFVNLLVASKLLFIEYLAYTGSIEGTFIAIPRIMAEHPFEWSWWPFWNCGLPFELTYLPFQHWAVAIFSVITGLTAARSLHIVSALAYALGPVTAFWMARAISRQPFTSFAAALLYSSVSLSALLIPDIRSDLGGAWNPQRLHVLVFYAGDPEVFALALLPTAVLLLYRSVTSARRVWKVLAGIACSVVALTSAFGITMLAIAAIAFMLIYRRPLTVILIGVLTYCLVSPWISPLFLQAVRENSPTSGGDFRYTRSAYIAVALAAAAFPLLWLALRRLRLAAHLQFFWLIAYPPTVAVAVWYTARVALVPQPSRYHLEMDLMLMIAIVFTTAALLPRKMVVPVVLAGCAIQTVHSWDYAVNLIKPVEKTSLSEYKMRHGYVTACQMPECFSPDRPVSCSMLSRTISSYQAATTNTLETDGCAW